jgi:hypothetical protein
MDPNPDHLIFWIHSIQSRVDIVSYSLIIVGTHADNMPEEQVGTLPPWV